MSRGRGYLILLILLVKDLLTNRPDAHCRHSFKTSTFRFNFLNMGFSG
jgi:hypothetical protein